MLKNLKEIAINPLIAGSFFLFAGGILTSFFNFLFNIAMSRNLKVEDYGVLISLISIITLLSIPSGAITPTVVTVAGRLFAKNEKAHIHAFYLKLLKALIAAGVVLFLIFFVFSNQLSAFFNINNNFLFALTIIGVGLFYILGLNNSFLQAKLSFKFLSFTSAISAFLKLFLSLILVMLGFSVEGALFGFLISIIFTIIIGVFYFKDFIFFKTENLPKISYKSLISYGIPSAVIVFCLNSLISTDILLVKHLFNSYEAGLYAGLSLVGRVIFFLSAPIGVVMFPIIVKRLENGQNYKIIFYSSLALVFLLSILVTIFYYFFPDFSMVFFLKKTDYLAASQYLFNFSIFITLYTLVSIISYYFLSLKRKSFMFVLLSGAIFQAAGIFIFHNNFYTIINISVVSCIFILLASFFMFFKSI